MFFVYSLGLGWIWSKSVQFWSYLHFGFMQKKLVPNVLKSTNPTILHRFFQGTKTILAKPKGRQVMYWTTAPEKQPSKQILQSFNLGDFQEFAYWGLLFGWNAVSGQYLTFWGVVSRYFSAYISSWAISTYWDDAPSTQKASRRIVFAIFSIDRAQDCPSAKSLGRPVTRVMLFIGNVF